MLGNMPKNIEPNITADFTFTDGFYIHDCGLDMDKVNKATLKNRKVRNHMAGIDRSLQGLKSACIDMIKDRLGVDIDFNMSITCYNSPASYHYDKHTNILNATMVRRMGVWGGCIHIPELKYCFEMANNSLLVFPAWKYLHGVTPIYGEGYRNSFILYSMSQTSSRV